MRPSTSISDELLSAYLDRRVSEAERRRVETALAGDPALQARLEGLQAVVHLLQNAPAVVVPRPMTITEAQALAAGAYVAGAREAGFWQRWMPKLAPLATAIVGVMFILSLAFPAVNLLAPPMTSSSEPAELMAQAKPVEGEAQPVVVVTKVVEAEKVVERPASANQAAPEATRAPPAMLAESPAVALEAVEAAASPVVAVEVVARDSQSKGGEKDAPVEEGAAATSEQSQNASPSDVPQHSPLPWLLGILFILLLFLTWRITLAPRRKE